jgi:hypothetical protein
MSRSRRWLFLLAAAASCACPLLWSPSSWAAPTPLAVGCTWLLFGCLVGLRPALRLPELVLLMALLTPGLLVALTAYADLSVPEAYGMVGRVLFSLGLHAALNSLPAGFKSSTASNLTRFGVTLAVPLAFALLLGNGPVLLSAALAAFAWSVLLVLRSRPSRG